MSQIVLLRGSSCTEAPYCSVVNHWVSFLFCFVLFLLFSSFWVDLNLWRYTVLLRFPWFPCVASHTHKANQLTGSNARGMARHLKTDLKPAMARLESGAST